MPDAPIGGQAVLEGVMMRGVAHWAVAVQPPEGRPVAVSSFELEKPRRRVVQRLPFVRGSVAMWQSMAIGMRALTIAANAQMVEEPAAVELSLGDVSQVAVAVDAGPKAGDKAKGGGNAALTGAVWTGTIVIAIVFAIGVFFVLPVSLTDLFKHQLGSSVAFWAVEGVVRTVIFLAYLLLLARMRDMRRVFEYHGAEHKVIACYEAGDELTPERATLQSRFHPRCGTSFLLIVMIVAIFVFAPLGLPSLWLLILTRILGVPVIVGISFEIIRFAGRNRDKAWVQAIIWPGMQLQKLTTREPDHQQLAVAIAALSAVLDKETPGLSAADMIGVEVVA
jgi:uncharacterized protein YqhQ